MLSRASTDAGTRLRHAKSTSSVRSRARSVKAEPLDPFTAREHATTAAVTAYERAYAMERTMSQRRSDIQRQKGSTSRNSQGSHFPAREPSLRHAGESISHRRRASSRSKKVSQERNPRQPNDASISQSSAQPTLNENTRPPIWPTHTPSAPVTPVRKEVRKSRSLYSSWSLGMSTPRDGRQNMSLDINRSADHAFSGYLAPTTGGFSSPLTGASVQLGKGNAAEIAAARDRYLHDFQQKSRLRSRPSFMMAHFKKRQDKEQTATTAADEDGTAVSPPATAIPTSLPAVLPLKSVERTRSISNSLRNKIKRVFRKESNSPTSLPAQQVDATRLYFGDSTSTIPGTTSIGNRVPTPAIDSLARPDSRQSSHHRIPSGTSQSRSRASSGEQSEGEFSNTKSRVTSWTNSSLTGSIVTRDGKRLTIIPEDGGPQEGAEGTTQSSSSTLRRRASSIIRHAPFRKPLHSSPADAAKGVDSFDVFSALKSRLGKAGLNGDLDFDLPKPVTRAHVKTERDTLPSQTKSSPITSKLTRATRATIRTVTPDCGEGSGTARSRANVVQPYHVPVQSQEPSQQLVLRTAESPESDGSGLTVPRIRLHRAPKATTPSAERIANRKEKAETRWQTPLEGCSPNFLKKTRRAMAGDNPYELTSLDKSNLLSKTIITPERTSSRRDTDGQNKMLTTTLPSKANPPLSPSIYSKDSTGESPLRKESHGSNTESEGGLAGTAVIITSHPVKSYTLGSPPKPKSVANSARSSKDWKAWLSKEVLELSAVQKTNFTISEELLGKPTGHQREHAQIVEGEDVKIGNGASRKVSSSHVNSVKPKLAERPKLEERPSSRMNERYPMVETNRTPSDQSQRSVHSQMSSRSREGTKSPEASSTSSASKTTSRENKVPRRPNAYSARSLFPQRPLNRPQSLQGINAANGYGPGQGNSSIAHYMTSSEETGFQGAGPGPTLTVPAPTAPSPNHPVRFHFGTSPSTTTGSHRPRSAFDLRNQYACRTDAQRPGGASANPVSLRRKPVTGPVLDGETLQMILQGPYSPSKNSPSFERLERSSPFGRKENTPTPTPTRLWLTDDKEKESPARNFGTPTGGQLLAERWLSARQRGEPLKGRMGSESPAFL